MAESIRAKRLYALRDYHGKYVELPASWPAVDERFVSVCHELALHATLEDAYSFLGDEILEDGVGSDLAVYDLDTGERVELHVSTPVVSRAEDQGVMENPLDA